MRACKQLAAVAIACLALAAAAQDKAQPVLASATPLQKMTLAEAYRLALENDANLAAARSTFAARSERLPQAKAALLPNISAQYGRNLNDLFSVTPNFLTGGLTRSARDYYSGTYAVIARQQLFRPQLWADYRQAEAQVEDAHAQYDKEVQNLAVRVSTAYLQVLLSQEQIALIAAQKKAYTTQLDAARKSLAAGSGTRTDVDQAIAQLDLAVAQELQAKQNLDYTRRTLQALTNVPVVEVAGVDEKRLPLGDTMNGGLQAWVDRAFATSPEVRSQQAQRDAARQDVEKARAGHLPTVDGIVQYTNSVSETVTSINQKYENKTVGVQINIPIFAGGYVNSQVRQALASLETAENQLEALKRDLSLRVEKEYRGVTEGVLQVRALEQAVRSGQTAATSASRSYQGGVRTVVDVLNAEEKLVQAQRDLAEARYNYLLSRIRLLALAGEADQSAIDDVNRWLVP